MKLLFRVDVNTLIGTGHLMRCLALAQAWQDAGGRSVFVLGMEAPALTYRLNKIEGMQVRYLSAQPGSADDAIQTTDMAGQIEATWVVLDGYHFTPQYQRIIKDSGLCLLLIDDKGHCDHYYADILLNQNLHAHEGLYVSREPFTHLLLGTRYTLLRREFIKWKEWKRKIPNVARKVLVTLGGSDPDNQTLRVIRALRQLDVDGLEAVVVVGANNPHFRKLKSAIHSSRFHVNIVYNVFDMPELMTWADVAISAGGSTCWEMAFMGLPTVLLVLAENQQAIAASLDNASAAISLGLYRKVSLAKIASTLLALLENHSLRQEMSQRAKKLVDGFGTERVIESLGAKLHSNLGSS
jgi:UDP-2,4-diacetamido-2,4,6-trideoxy-beta-L-altropyranose hydrolase